MEIAHQNWKLPHRRNNTMIKMKAGVYGYKENGVVIPKDINSEPFSLKAEKEEELVKLGIAEYVTETKAKASKRQKTDVTEGEESIV